ncbi:MAG: EF2563 family selenium-dependent molybdenum hydroxylase system protein [Anaerolineae bacterium]|nr:EF2563 family selenium-dependent molybdenum hydroxylase system protein [Anaerolineae bacterium]
MAQSEPTAAFGSALVLVRGAGDLATGVALRLRRAGFPVLMTELPWPLAVRTAVSFSAVVHNVAVVIEGVRGRRARLDRPETIHAALDAGEVAVVVDPDGDSIRTFRPAAVIDARLAKRNLGTRRDDAPLVIALGPGFVAGVDCHAVIETNRGHNLGRVYWRGEAEPDTGKPAGINGRDTDRVLRAPADGRMLAYGACVGLPVRHGQLLATVGGEPVRAPFDGVLRGLVEDDTLLTAGTKIGDIDPRGQQQHCFTVSDKSLAIGGGVVEAILSAPQRREALAMRRAADAAMRAEKGR